MPWSKFSYKRKSSREFNSFFFNTLYGPRQEKNKPATRLIGLWTLINHSELVHYYHLPLIDFIIGACAAHCGDPVLHVRTDYSELCFLLRFSSCYNIPIHLKYIQLHFIQLWNVNKFIWYFHFLLLYTSAIY